MPWPPVGIAPSPPATLTGDFAAPDPTTLRAREDRDRGEARLVLRPLPLPCPRDRQASRLLSFSLTHRSPTAGASRRAAALMTADIPAITCRLPGQDEILLLKRSPTVTPNARI